MALAPRRDRVTRRATLGASSLRITDAWDTRGGADMLGPRLAASALQLRGGARWRTLPFGTSTSSVSEKSYSLGAGTQLARGRAALDVTGIRATREAGSNISETAFTLVVGVPVRP